MSDALIKDYISRAIYWDPQLANHQVELHIDKTVQPVAQRHRRIPFHLGQQAERHY